MQTQYRANGRHRVLYQPRRDPRLQELALAMGTHCGKVVLAGIDAVSPNQKDPDGHRRLVAMELTRAVLPECFHMIAAVCGFYVEQKVPTLFFDLVAAARSTVNTPVRAVEAVPRSARRASQPAAAPSTAPGSVRPAGRPVRQRIPRQAVVNRRGA